MGLPRCALPILDWNSLCSMWLSIFTNASVHKNHNQQAKTKGKSLHCPFGPVLRVSGGFKIPSLTWLWASLPHLPGWVKLIKALSSFHQNQITGSPFPTGSFPDSAIRAQQMLAEPGIDSDIISSALWLRKPYTLHSFCSVINKSVYPVCLLVNSTNFLFTLRKQIYKRAFSVGAFWKWLCRGKIKPTLQCLYADLQRKSHPKKKEMAAAALPG